MNETKRTPELVAEVLRRMSLGEPLTVVCRDQGIHYTTWREWCRADQSLDIAHTQAREEGFDAIAADCLKIADETIRDTVMVGPADDKREAANTEWISRSKLRVETRLKLLAKWDPKRYGEKLDVTMEVNDRASILRKKREERLSARKD